MTLVAHPAPVGSHCEQCHAWLGSGDGFARICISCRSVDEPAPAQPDLGFQHIGDVVRPIMERLSANQDRVDALLNQVEGQAADLRRMTMENTVLRARLRMMEHKPASGSAS